MLKENLYGVTYANIDWNAPDRTWDCSQWLDEFLDAFYLWSLEQPEILHVLAHAVFGEALFHLEGYGTNDTGFGLSTPINVYKPTVADWLRNYAAEHPTPQPLYVLIAKRDPETKICMECDGGGFHEMFAHVRDGRKAVPERFRRLKTVV